MNFKVDDDLHKDYKAACDNTGVKMYFYIVQVMKEIVDEYKAEKEEYESEQSEYNSEQTNGH